MERTFVVRYVAGLWGTALVLALVILLSGCTGLTTGPAPAVTGTSGPSPTVSPTPTGTPESETPTSTPLPTARAAPAPDIPGPSPTPPPTTTTTPGPAQPTIAGPTGEPVITPVPTIATPALNLELLAPEDGAGVEVGAVRVLGRSRVDAAVGINGVPVEVAADGSFQHDLDLEEGANLIEAVATTLSGEIAFQESAVFFVSTAAGLPFSLFYPSDGLVVSDPSVAVVGGTRPDAVVGVNGVPVDINSSGIFATSISLDEGGNFIEVLATDISGNVRFQTVAVFYIP